MENMLYQYKIDLFLGSDHHISSLVCMGFNRKFPGYQKVIRLLVLGITQHHKKYINP